MQITVHRARVASRRPSRPRAWLAASAAALLAALAVAGPAAAAPTAPAGGPPAPAPTGNPPATGFSFGATNPGFVMGDGITPCDPITGRGCN